MKNIVFLSEDFGKALQSLGDLDVPVTTAYKIAKNADALGQANKTFDELRKKLILKYCIKWEADAETKDGEPSAYKAGDPQVVDNNYSFTKENADAFGKEMNDLLNIDFTVPYKLSQKEFGEKAQLKTRYLLLLADMLSDLDLTKVEEPKKEAANG